MTDELELLRDWDADASPLSEPSRAQARHRLLNTIARGERHPGAAHSRRHALRLATAAVVTMAVAGTAVLITEDGTDEGGRGRSHRAGTNAPRMRNVAAVTVLNGAAARASKYEKPVAPRDDQFIYSKRVIRETERKTGAVKTYVDVNWDSVDGSQRSLTMELGRVIWEEPMGKNESVWPPREWSKLKRLPTDPEKLITRIGVGTSGKSLDDFTAWDWYDAYFMLGELLKWPVLPEGLRPAAYEALALVPGVRATPGMKDSAGRTGVGISYPEHASEKGKYLIFDPESYDFLGFRAERTSRSGKQTYIQLSHVADWAIVDHLKQRPQAVSPTSRR